MEQRICTLLYFLSCISRCYMPAEDIILSGVHNIHSCSTPCIIDQSIKTTYIGSFELGTKLVPPIKHVAARIRSFVWRSCRRRRKVIRSEGNRSMMRFASNNNHRTCTITHTHTQTHLSPHTHTLHLEAHDPLFPAIFETLSKLQSRGRF